MEILPFTPANRNNLIGWIAGRSDGAQYGTSVVYNFPKTKLVDGPLQIEARIDQNAQLSGQLTLWNQQGSHVRRGALLVIPIRPRATVCGADLLASGAQSDAGIAPGRSRSAGSSGVRTNIRVGTRVPVRWSGLVDERCASPRGSGPQDIGIPLELQPGAAFNTLIAEAAKDFADYQRLTAEGKLAEAGQKLEELKRALDKLNTRPK